MKTAIYYFSISLLITHEIDAVGSAEWQLLYILRSLPETTAFSFFVLAHVPLFFVLLWFSHHSNNRIQMRFRFGVSVFLVIHALLHLRLSGNPGYAFSGVLSNSLIYGAGLVGAVHALLSFKKGELQNS
ncbi:hypothetical protein BVX98_06190 [bacterium F11]|nr:hypothetical protein BVX98_06190 [bacterium F11]